MRNAELRERFREKEETVRMIFADENFVYVENDKLTFVFLLAV